MPNTYFQFKQFRIEQERCAMKVCTDSCLFGAWIEVDKRVEHILDIGTGTGLLSLMLAQKSTAHIHGIEIDENAYLQTMENLENSVWRDRFTSYSGDVKTFHFNKQFDFIVCNPPFYENHADSNSHTEKIAKHSMFLNLTNLLNVINKLLKPEGTFAVLLPYYRKEEIENKAKTHNFYVKKTLCIKQTPSHDYFRYAAIFSRQKCDLITHEEFSVKDENAKYTYEAIHLLQPFYMYL